MRKQLPGIALAFAIAFTFLLSASAQNKQPSDAPSRPDANPAHDLTGVWFDDHPRLITVMQRYWAYEFTPEEPPMTPWGQEQFKSAKPSFGHHAYPLAESNDPIYHTCVPMGFPRIFLYPLPMQIVQTPGEVIMLFEYDSVRHQIFTDGRPHDTTLGPLWMGDSIGHWEGDTLVTDTVNFNDKTWIDRIGHPHSAALHVAERIRRIDHDHLVDDITIEDPKAYTRPWTAHLPFVLKPKWTLAEAFCEDENSFENIETDETKPAK
ncbi:MAG TPA: hypothetical protein VGP19_11465 [Candidatus Acidoferrales bacterium]|jgi:hypothetical protein|nr:hypothetical protein [Candidatus Acidoferrales bacterium]